MAKFSRLYVVIFLIAGVFVLPCPFFTSFSSIFNTAAIRPFSLSSLSALAVSFILFKGIKLKNKLYYNKFLSILLFLFLIIVTVQFYIFDKSSFNEFFFSIFWISVPLFIYLFSSVVIKYLSVYIYILWITDLLVCFYTPGAKVGIAGNRNWHAIFLLVVLLFSIYLTSHIINYIKKIKTLSAKLAITAIYLITAILVGYTTYLFYKCDSRAAVLVGIIMLLIFSCIKFIDCLKINLKTLKLQHYFLTLSILIISFTVLILVLFYYYNNKGEIASSNRYPYALLNHVKSTLDDDVRIPLWEGSFNLIKDYPFIGTSPGRFESVFASYRPLEYFTKSNNAVRSNHPHNTLLYIAASFGLPALVLWYFLWIYPIIYCFIIYSKLTVFMRITLFAYLCLFFHGLLDLVLFHWPTIFLAAIFLGLLWNETWSGNKNSTSCLMIRNQRLQTGNLGAVDRARKTENCNLMKFVIYVTAIIILGFTLYNVYLDYQSSYFFRTGDFYAKKKKDERALFQYQKGLTYKREPKYIYKAGIRSITSLDNPELALHFFSYFDDILSYDYAHKNGFIALSLVKLGKYNLTIPFLIKEAVNYPLSVGAWYRLSLMQRQQKMYKEAEVSFKNMQRALSTKGLPPNALDLLIKNPTYDSHPDRIPKKILNKLQSDSDIK